MIERKRVAGALVGLLVLTVVACGKEASSPVSAAPTPADAGPVTVQSCGRSVTSASPPQRIVAGTGASASTFFALGVGDRLAGVGGTSSSAPPEFAGKLATVPKLGDKSTGPKELVLSKQPDLVFGSGPFYFDASSGQASVEELTKSGVAAYISNQGCADADGSLSNLYLDDAWDLPAREVARRCAVVAQEGTAEFDFSAHEIVLMGRGPHKRALDRDAESDHRIVHEALTRVGVAHLSERSFATLSGGERQRVLVARALAQQAPILLLDEPTNHLDVRATLDLLDLVRSLRLTTLCVLHDLNHAATYCHRLYLLHHGQIIADGNPAEVLTAPLLRQVFGVEAHRVQHPITGGLQLLFSNLADNHERQTR